MRRTLSIKLTLRKLESSHECEKVNLIVKSSLKIERISNARTIKNGVAKFFGQSVLLPLQIHDFSFLILEHETDTCIVKMFVPHSVVAQFSPRRNVFTCCEGDFKLTWEAQLVSDTEDKNNDITDRDMNDFDDMENGQNGKASIQPADKIRDRRKTIKNNRLSGAISEPPELLKKLSVQQQQNVRNRLAHKRSIQGFIFDKQQKGIFQQNMPMVDEIDLTSKKSTIKSKHNPKPNTKQTSSVSKKQRSIKSAEKKISAIEPILPRSRSPNFEIRKIQRNRLGLLEKIGVREMVFTGIFGVISGITAAQI